VVVFTHQEDLAEVAGRAGLVDRDVVLVYLDEHLGG
jgi:hypothetical protein